MARRTNLFTSIADARRFWKEQRGRGLKEVILERIITDHWDAKDADSSDGEPTLITGVGSKGGIAKPGRDHRSRGAPAPHALGRRRAPALGSARAPRAQPNERRGSIEGGSRAHTSGAK